MRRLTLWQAVAISSQFGVLLAVSVLVGTGLGILVDRQTGVGLIAILVGALLGMISGIVSVVKLVQAFVRPNSETRAPGPTDDSEPSTTDHDR